MLTCVDLVKTFGKKYRITWDEAYDAKGVPHRCRDAWYAQIPCKWGTIYPQGGDCLAVEVDYHPRTAAKLEAIPGVKKTQDGDQEKTFVFPLELFDTVASIVMPRKKRVLSEAHKQALIQNAHRFVKKSEAGV